MPGHYGNKQSEAWGWMLPHIMPTFSLIMSAFVTESSKNKELVDKFHFYPTFALALVYLFMILISLSIHISTSYTPFEVMKTSNLWLGPFQGLVGASIGFFSPRKKKSNRRK